eukprot:6172910-Pleurochrysis_carterae.AAC.4
MEGRRYRIRLHASRNCHTGNMRLDTAIPCAKAHPRDVVSPSDRAHRVRNDLHMRISSAPIYAHARRAQPVLQDQCKARSQDRSHSSATLQQPSTRPTVNLPLLPCAACPGGH